MFFKKNFKIGNTTIGEGQKTFIVAEISSNHQSDINKIKELISESKEIGVNAVKIQTYSANSITVNSNKRDFKIPKNNQWSKYNFFYDLYDKASIPLEWYDEIFHHAKKEKIKIFSSPFSKEDLKTLIKYNVPAYKIASAEINYIQLLEEVSNQKKPIILSTGMAIESDIVTALKIFKNNNVVILLCNSSYPTNYKDINLNGIRYISEKFNTIVGLSDHSIGNTIPITAVSLGAKLIEKHIKLKDDKKSPDHFFSINTKDFGIMIKEIRNVELTLNNKKFLFKPSKKILISRRSIYVIDDIKKGEYFSYKNLGIRRPAYSLDPINMKRFLGKKTNRNLTVGDRLKLNYIRKN